MKFLDCSGVSWFTLDGGCQVLWMPLEMSLQYGDTGAGRGRLRDCLEERDELGREQLLDRVVVVARLAGRHVAGAARR